MANGHLLASMDAAGYVGEFFRTHCNTDTKLNCWHHLSSSLTCEFIDAHFLTKSCPTNTGMGHLMLMNRHHYALDHSVPDFATTNMIWEQKWINTKFHTLLRFGTKSPLVALRLLHAVPTADHISSIVANSLPSAVQAVIEGLRESLVVEVHNTVKAELSALCTGSVDRPSRLPGVGRFSPC
jgi:hypothetical protein